jgi:ribonuclease HIII
MPRKQETEGSEGDSEKKITMYTTELDDAQMEKVHDYCEAHLWERFTPEYSNFGYKAKVEKLTIVGYLSGKLVVSGKGTEDFVRDFIEPYVTKAAKLGYDEVLHPDWYEPHAGLDEAGKGDLFGPVVAATVIADGEAVRKWRKAGVRDSKTIVDTNILKLEKLIKGTPGVVVKTAYCGMDKYNMLMAKPRANLNLLLAWLHARALEAAIAEKTVPWGLLDQFSKTPLVQRQMKKDGVVFDLRMRTHGESDPIVAAASICARAEFVRQTKALSELAGEPLKKGASNFVKEQAKKLVEKNGADFLGKIAKLHFRTALEVLGLPVEEKKPWGFYAHGRKKSSGTEAAPENGEE